MPPKIPPLPPESLDAIEAAAADWLVLKDRGFTAAQRQDFARWLALDSRHAEVFRALDAAWTFLRTDHAVTAAARDAAAVGAREAAAAGTNARAIIVPFAGRRFWRTTGLAAAAAVVLGAVLWQGGTLSESAAPFRSVTTTDVGALRRLDLPDGTVVQLNTDSLVEVNYTAADRRVKLTRGEAHFTVAKNPQRPFIVTVSGVDVRAVGTSFNVRLRPESVEVLVTEGKVNVVPPRAGPAATATEASVADTFLTAGQRTSVSLAAAPSPAPALVITVPEVEIKQALAWQERRLDFDATALADMVAEINRYNRHKLVIADPRLESHRFGGSFPAGDYATFVRLLENNFGVVSEQSADRTILRLPR